MKRLKYTFTALIVALLFVVLARPSFVSAHAGGVPQIFREPVGPYLVSVWTLPDPLAIGEANFIVLVTEEVEGQVDQYVLDADVKLRLYQGFSFGSAYIDATTTEATNNLFYETYTDLESGGEWTVEVNINDGEAVTTFPIDVLGEEANRINWFQYGGIGVAIIVVGWFVFQAFGVDEEDDEEDLRAGRSRG